MKTNTEVTKQNKKKKKGFTLIEVIAVLVLLGILAAIAVPQYLDLTQEAEARGIDAAVSELNGREALAWGENMLANSGVPVDADIETAVNPTSLGTDYTVVDNGDGTFGVTFGGTTVTLTRGTASATGPARWTR